MFPCAQVTRDEASTSAALPDPASLLAALEGHSFLRGYHLLLFRNRSAVPNTLGSWELCTGLGASSCAEGLPLAIFNEILDIACIGNRPATLRSPEGLFIFAAPFSLPDEAHFCLVGSGVRDQVLDLGGVESLAAMTSRDPVELLELLQKYPVAGKKDVEETAERVLRLIKEATENAVAPANNVLDKLSAVAGICAEIDKITTSAAVISLFLDTLIIVFDLPRLGIVFTGNACRELFPASDWEPPPAVTCKILPHRLHNLFPGEATGKTFVLGSEIASVFPEQNADMATCLQFLAKGDDSGLVVLLDTKLAEGDVSLIELVCSRVATRLQQLLQAEQLLRAKSQSQKMLDLVSSMLKIDDHNELYDTLLNAATGLVGAASGSFMVMDKNGEDLHIEAVRGINSHLAKSFTVKVGEGIAGKVAAGAAPLMIDNIESDVRTARLNRSRFRTKSFVSLPFSYNRQVIGVLNIADKENGNTFDENDLETLSSFADHVAGVVHHAKAKATWKCCPSTMVVDPLTGLYNRSFLLRRMQEEVSRCKRQNRNLALLHIEVLGSRDAGDKTMKAVADVLGGMLREMDVVARCGERSFSIMLPDTGKKESRLVGERIRARVAPSLLQQDCTLTADACVALGIAAFPEDGKNVEALVTAAENDIFLASASDTVATAPGVTLPSTSETAAELPADKGIMHHDARQLLPLLHNRPYGDSRPNARPIPRPYSGWPYEQSERQK